MKKKPIVWNYTGRRINRHVRLQWKLSRPSSPPLSEIIIDIIVQGWWWISIRSFYLPRSFFTRKIHSFSRILDCCECKHAEICTTLSFYSLSLSLSLSLSSRIMFVRKVSFSRDFRTVVPPVNSNVLRYFSLTTPRQTRFRSNSRMIDRRVVNFFKNSYTPREFFWHIAWHGI